ncbi:MAG: SURF1 family protein [Gammaproteobacteria bacterium]|nr:SURF1 family protein [Gammaproteobacteria bacterium]
MSSARRLPPALAFLLCLALAALFVRLGFWQWHRGVLRQQAVEGYAAGGARVIALTGASEDLALYQRVRVAGHLDAAHQFLLDNRSHHGRPGYEVLTPLVREGARTLLVDRGWVPFGASRRDLPVLTVSVEPLTLTGRLANLPAPGLALGRAPPQGAWPKLTAFPDMAQLQAAYGAPLEPRILLLDADSGPGYAREWTPPGISPMRNFSYAVQWWSFALATLVIVAVLALRRRGRA